ncbi:MAG: esterase [Bacteroides sp.]|nr:esterase [Bacteroides sp.]
MRKVISFVSLLLCVATVSAQQALWGGQDIVSPEIHPDHTVTFRFHAPKASSVQITGDFLPAQQVDTPQGTFDAPGVADLSKGADGLWTYTTPAPLAPELYSYSFLVDELKVTDPNNVYLIRDVASLTNVFLIDGGRADLYKVNAVPHGTVVRRWYFSPTLDKERRLTIYTPPGYEQSSDSYSVLYLLHGMGGDEEAWIALGRTAQILDNLIARGEARPTIVVMTNGNVYQEAAPGESTLGFYKPTMQLPQTMEGSMEESFPDVVRFVDSNYRTVAEKKGRAIAGLSMGGYHSLHISKEYPDMFDYIGLFSAAIFPGEDVESPVYDNFEQKLQTQFDQDPQLYWIAIGKTDFLYQANVDYRKILDEKGYKYIYFESEEGHIWKNWRIYLTEFVPLLFR